MSVSGIAKMKAYLMRLLGPFRIDTIRAALGKHSFDEVALVYNAFREEGFVGCMVDVGAHAGSSLGRFAASGWQVLAFEPDSENRKLLEIAHGHRVNLSIDPRAVSDEPASGMDFFASDVSSGISGLSAFHDSHRVKQTVDVTTLSEVLQQIGVDKVDFLKVDTEGHDLFVLKGFDWEAFQPLVVVCEFENRKTTPLGYTVSDLCEFLRVRGYVVKVSEWEPITEYGAAHTWARFLDDPSQIAEDAWGNLIALRPGTDLAQHVDDICSQI